MQNASTANSMAMQAQQDAAKQQATVDTARTAQEGRYTSLLNNPGYTAAEKTTINNNSMAPIGGTYDAANAAAGRHVATTGNSAGYGELLDKLARSKSTDVANIQGQNQQAYNDRAVGDRNTALAGLGGIYGMDVQSLAQKLGIPANYLQTSNQALGNAQTASTNPYLSSFLGAGATLGAAGIKALRSNG